MARRKSITETQILETAYQLVVEEGFKSFTARNIARHLNCSTQPIYLEFNSMGELKSAVMERIKTELTNQVSRRYTDDPIVDLGLAYIDFALENRMLYRAVFVEDHFGVAEMREFAFSTALKRFNDYAPAVKLDPQRRRDTLTGLWIVATGICNLMAPGFIELTRSQMTDILQAVVHDFIANKRFSIDAKQIKINQELVG
ncbi:TetR/AcrR family transcriptional regulator [Lacticaseibacillus sp. GG6-2]